MRRILSLLKHEDHVQPPINFKKLEHLRFGNHWSTLKKQYQLTEYLLSQKTFGLKNEEDIQHRNEKLHDEMLTHCNIIESWKRGGLFLATVIFYLNFIYEPAKHYDWQHKWDPKF